VAYFEDSEMLQDAAAWRPDIVISLWKYMSLLQIFGLDRLKKRCIHYELIMC